MKDEQKETSEAESNNTDGEDAMDISEPENLDDKELEEDSESDPSSSEEEDLVGNILEIQKTFRNLNSPKTMNS